MPFWGMVQAQSSIFCTVVCAYKALSPDGHTKGNQASSCDAQPIAGPWPLLPMCMGSCYLVIFRQLLVVCLQQFDFGLQAGNLLVEGWTLHSSDQQQCCPGDTPVTAVSCQHAPQR